MTDMTALLHHAILSKRPLLGAFQSSMTRSEYFTALCIVGIVNGVGPSVMQAIANGGLLDAAGRTFDVSVLVWIACVIGIGFLIEDRGDHIDLVDLVVGAAFVALTALPVAQASWFGLSVLGVYMLLVSAAGSTRQRGAKILIAITVPMLWSQLFFRLFSEIILHIDALLVGRVLGTQTAGNVVAFADGSGVLVILPACSSLAGLSLVVPSWVTISQTVQHDWSARDSLWCALAAIAVLAVNVGRVSVMGLSEARYQMVHGAWGNFVTGTLTLCLIVGFCIVGVRRELLARV